MELILIRHGLPLRVENPDGEPADPSLSEAGREQAERLARWLAHESIDALYASPMRRAHETAHPIARTLGLDIRLEPGVVEFDQHSEFYIPLEELKRLEPERWREMIANYQVADFGDFRKLVVGTLERIIDDHPGERVAVICHGGVINVWAGHVLGVEAPMFFEPDYTSVNRSLAARSGERMIVSLNDAAHLIAKR